MLTTGLPQPERRMAPARLALEPWVWTSSKPSSAMSFLTWRRAEKKPPSQTRVSIPNSAASRAKGPSRKQTSVTSMPRERLRSREWTCVFAPPVSPPLMRCITFKFRPPVILVTGGDLL